jgi:hypothetical protein
VCGVADNEYYIGRALRPFIFKWIAVRERVTVKESRAGSPLGRAKGLQYVYPGESIRNIH